MRVFIYRRRFVFNTFPPLLLKQRWASLVFGLFQLSLRSKASEKWSPLCFEHVIFFSVVNTFQCLFFVDHTFNFIFRKAEDVPMSDEPAAKRLKLSSDSTAAAASAGEAEAAAAAESETTTNHQPGTRT